MNAELQIRFRPRLISFLFVVGFLSLWPISRAEAAPHRIGVRTVNGVGEFYDRVTGARFIPRGVNYIRLGPYPDGSGGTVLYHSTFDPGRYDHATAASDLAAISASSYNVVRVFINPAVAGTPTGGLSNDYIANIADFLRLSRAAGVYVILTQDGIPGGDYSRPYDECAQWQPDDNLSLLSTCGVRANKLYFRDLVRALVLQGAPLDAILSYELRNELNYQSGAPPLSLSSGSVVAANGVSYDMGDATQKERMLEENLVFWVDTIRTTILAEDATALVSAGFFEPQKPNPARVGDPRISITAPAIWLSQADFIDLHTYPGQGLDLSQYVENYGIAGMQRKPIVMGEFGAFRGSYSTAAKAAKALMDWQVESCLFGFDGWLAWTWNTEEQPELYNALSGRGEINQVLSPARRSDPCLPGKFSFIEENIALNAAASASEELQSPAKFAVDGSTETGWNAGDFAPQWIQIDLGATHDVQRFRLVVAQSPSGSTVHRLWAGSTQNELKLVHEFAGVTKNLDELVYEPSSALQGIQFVKVETTQSPSWVAWNEIEVVAVPPLDLQPCVRDGDTACLLGGRFQVEVDWQTTSGNGIAHVMSFGGERTENDQSVFWWFFSPASFEMGVKMLDACVPALGNKYWVFISGLTNQGWTVRVRDSQTGATRSYSNAVNHLSETFADTAAFSCQQ